MDTIMNPRTGRMVKRTGTIGRALVVACSQGCDKKATAPPKAKAPTISKTKMTRIQRKVRRLGKEQVKAKKELGKKIEQIADKLVRKSAPTPPKGESTYSDLNFRLLPLDYDNTPKDRKRFQQLVIKNKSDQIKEQKAFKKSVAAKGGGSDGQMFNIKKGIEKMEEEMKYIKTDKYLMYLKKMRGNDKTVNEKKAEKAKAKGKKLSKAAFIDEFDNDQMKKGVFGLRTNYHDIYVSYRNDYPRMARTESQMDKLSMYAERQVNKQLYDHYKANGNLKSFQVSNIYGKAF